MKRILRRIPGVSVLARLRSLATLHRRVPLLHQPGHYYSVIPSFEEIEGDRDRIFDEQAEVVGIDLEGEEARRLRVAFPQLAEDYPFGAKPGNGWRYGARNNFFSEADAVVLYCFLRHLQPRRWIEVGCGHSTRVLLDTNREVLGDAIDCTLIDPFAGSLLPWLTPDERSRHMVREKRVQDVELGLFEELEANDVLFVDSSHAVKAGSDVNWLFFEVFPRLAPGVVIHVHDIPWPFEYPEPWYKRGFAWNETYLVRALLQESDRYGVLWFNSYMASRHVDYLQASMPLCLEDGVSLWFRRK